MFVNTYPGITSYLTYISLDAPVSKYTSVPRHTSLLGGLTETVDPSPQTMTGVLTKSQVETSMGH